MPARDVIVIGASAGGIEALQMLLPTLPADMPAAVFIVVHMTAEAPSRLPWILQRWAEMKVMAAQDQAPIKHGCIYVAVPGLHLSLQNGQMRLSPGPHENLHRPSIDVLFRTAASSYADRTIGVLLSGSLDDGVVGLMRIQGAGGMTAVQDPAEALVPSMPQKALDAMEIDYCATASALGGVLDQLVRGESSRIKLHAAIGCGQSNAQSHSQRDHKHETRTEQRTMITNEQQVYARPASGFSCPECHGSLWQVEDGELVRFRCRVGHSYNVESMLSGQQEALERGLWLAVRILEERVEICQRMEQRAISDGNEGIAARYHRRSGQAQEQATSLRHVLDQCIERSQIESPR